jgi:serine/threonine protein kinase
MECVARAVMNNGVRGLAEFVPGGGYLVDVVKEAMKLLKERRKMAQIRAEIAAAAAAAATSEEARTAAEEVTREVVKEAGPAVPAEDRVTLELFLTQIPAAVRQTMKRADDPAGKTVPPDLALDHPEDLLRLLPHRLPHFRPGADLPGRPGWRLDDLLGTGGFWEVWLALHTFVPNRHGAVKFCTDPAARAKLVSHEGKVIARVMARGEHPTVVPLLDAVLDGDAPWLMYEYVGGGCLTDLVHRWQSLPPSEREAATVAALHELAAAVGTFHRLDPPIVHRDLKPSNVLLTTAGRLRITDFGIGGAALDALRTHHPTGMSVVTGWLETSLRGSYTPLYASPQQRAGAAPDPRDDVHALGVIGYQLLTGRLDQAPGIDAADDLRDAGVGEPLIGLLSRSVAQKPDRRPRDAAELAEKLAEVKKPLPEAGRGAAGREPVSPAAPSHSENGVGVLGPTPTPPESPPAAVQPPPNSPRNRRSGASRSAGCGSPGRPTRRAQAGRRTG